MAAEALADEKAVEAGLKLAEQARLEVHGSIQGGTTISVGRKTLFVAEDRAGGAYYLSDGEIVSGVIQP
mgnify:CR=1 FL=1